MKKLRSSGKLSLNRETLATLERLGSVHLAGVAGGASAPCTGGSSCGIPRCTCPPA